jgi:hypothetical protein
MTTADGDGQLKSIGIPTARRKTINASTVVSFVAVYIGAVSRLGAGVGRCQHCEQQTGGNAESVCLLRYAKIH